MARKKRKVSETGIYHITNRGVNHMPIFKKDSDYKKYLRILEFYRHEHGVQILSYCLMNNHVHLLVRCTDTDSTLARFMQSLSSAYVFYFNKQNVRVGPLFQDRYFSSCVENKRYLMAVIRYVHQNPIKAYGVKNVADYRWSSYFEYCEESSVFDLKSGDATISICDTQWLREVLSFKDNNEIADFIKSSGTVEEEKKLYFELEYWRLSESEVAVVFNRTLKKMYPHASEIDFAHSKRYMAIDVLDEMNRDKKFEFVMALLDEGLSGQQILSFGRFNKRMVYETRNRWLEELDI